jgi:hypothetical protein
MISAILNRKYQIEANEDIITSSIFDTLFLLPDDIIWEILRESCYFNDSLPNNVGNLLREEINFWPSWNSEGTENASWILPDLFIRFENLDIIIEAKRECNSQEVKQWKNEIISYNNEYGIGSKNLILIAIDGITCKDKEEISFENNHKKVPVFKTRWQKILDIIVDKRDKYTKNNTCLQQKYILDNIIKYFECFGIFTIVWLSDLQNDFSGINLTYENDMKILTNMEAQYG